MNAQSETIKEPEGEREDGIRQERRATHEWTCAGRGTAHIGAHLIKAGYLGKYDFCSITCHDRKIGTAIFPSAPDAA